MIDCDAIKARIAEVRDHDAKATPGEWVPGAYDSATLYCNDPNSPIVTVAALVDCREEDLDLIAALRSLAPQLADDAEGLLEENERRLEERNLLLSVVLQAAGALQTNDDFPEPPSQERINKMCSLLAQTYLSVVNNPAFDRPFETAEYVVISQSLLSELERQAGLEQDEVAGLREANQKLIEALKSLHTGCLNPTYGHDSIEDRSVVIPCNQCSGCAVAKVLAEVEK